MVCEAVKGYICNMEVYSAEGKKLKDTLLSLLDRNLGQNHHIYQNNVYNSVRLAQTLLDRNVRVCSTMKAKVYNSVRLAQTLLDRNVRVCSTMKAKRCIPLDLEREGKLLKKGQ